MRKRFEGWYYKQRANGLSLALIPGRSAGGAFIQVVTDDRSYQVDYPPEEYQRHGNSLRIGSSQFSESGVILDIAGGGLRLSGYLIYSGLTPLRGDIMGPFRFFPMECRHGVVSMRHAVEGSVSLNGETLDFSRGKGYIETDSGSSFPEGYAWVQCGDFDRNCSIMASAARIPFAGLKFWGCICAVWLDGREYRLATYNGARIVRCGPGGLELRQGKYKLTADVQARDGLALSAPRNGLMGRTIHESIACPARFVFSMGDTVLFDGNGQASYEFVTTQLTPE